MHQYFIAIEKHLDSILKMSDNLEILIPIEGFEDANDLITRKRQF